MHARLHSASIPRPRLALLFVLFFLICCGLGYSSLNRIDWRQAPGGLVDLQKYAAMVTSPPTGDPDDHMQFRILIPYLAKPVYRLTKDHLGSWDPIMFSLLVVNSSFVAATVVVLLAVIYRLLGNYSIALGSALIYLLNFSVPNLRLIGFIDAGEGLFLMLLVWSLCGNSYWMLPLWAIPGAMAKESFVPYLMVFTLAWWICSRKTLVRPYRAAAWMVGSWFAALTTLAVLQRAITHVYRSPLRFGLELHGKGGYFSHFLRSFADRNFWYIFLWLLPLSLLRLRRLPLNWRMATAATCVTAFALDAYYGGAPGTIGRTLFSVAGPLLSASVAILLFAGVGTEPAAPKEASVV
jgi:hypothetical protein